VETNIQDCMKIISEAKERPPYHLSPPFKEKKKGGEGGSKAWWSMEDSMLGGQLKVACLVVNGRSHAWWPMECERKTHFHLFHFPLTNFTLNLQFFSFDLTVLFYHGPKSLLMPFFPFLQFINYDCAPQCNKSFTLSLSI
jgi:hypothetical protein